MDKRVKELLETMSCITGLSLEQLTERSRKEPLCYVRYCIFYTLYYEGWTTTAIGNEFGMNHASVLHGIKCMRDALEVKGTYQKQLELYEKFIHAINMKKKIYISLPITGRDENERRYYANSIITMLGRTMPEYEVVNPLDNKLEYNVHWSKHMTEDIKMLLECDAIYMCKDWQWSHGCKLEHDIATSCGLDVYYQEGFWKAPIKE